MWETIINQKLLSNRFLHIYFTEHRKWAISAHGEKSKDV